MKINDPLDVGGPASFNNVVYGNAPVSMSGAPINEAQGADIASAGTVNLDTATGNLVDVTGTTTITAITLSVGRERVVRFTGALTLTHGASLVLPGAANITTAAGDFAIFRGYASGVVRCVVYQRASGVPVAGTVAAATQAEQETGTATTVYTSPGRQHFHPSACKAWVDFDGTGTPAVSTSYNVTSITDTATGRFAINLTTAFSGTHYGIVGWARQGSGGTNRISCMSNDALSATVINMRVFDTGGTLGDTESNFVACYGDQA